MDQSLDFKTIVLLFALLANLALVFLIYWRGRKNLNNISYSLVISAVILWMFGMIFYRIVPAEASVFWCKILYVNATFTSSLFLLFTFIFPAGKLRLKKWQVFLIFVPNIFIILTILLPNLMIKEVIIRPGQEKLIIFGPWYFLYTFYILIYFFAGFRNLFKEYRLSSGISKSQLRYVFSGYFISANIAFFTNLLMPWWGNTEFNWLGQVCTLIWVGLTTYAIIAHRLMDIKLVMRRSTVYLATILTIVLPAFAVLFFGLPLFPDFLVLVNLILLILAVSVFTALRNFYYRLANKYFFSSLYDSSQVIGKLSDKLRSTLDIDKIYEFVADTLTDAFHSKAVGFLLREEETGDYLVQYNQGFNIGQQMRFQGDKDLEQEFAKHNKSLVVEELKGETYKSKKPLFELLTGLDVAILTPLNIKDRTIGLIALASKESKDMYNDEDLRVLEVVGAQSAMAIENALLFEETKEFAGKLKKEVEKATAELQKANVELRKLDQAKSDFISIASHQLRTPVSVIKGITSMILEGDLEKMPQEKQKHFFQSLWQKGCKLENIISDILNATEMTSTKYQVKERRADLVDLKELLQEVIKDFQPAAQEREIDLSLLFSKKPTIKIYGEKEYLREALSNLIDNALKYTPSLKPGSETRDTRKEKGIIEINITKDKNNVIISIKDNGIGIPEKEIPDLFEKFTRASNARDMYTDGSGLGLFVVKEVIEGHHGKVWIESQMNKGTTFFVRLPLYTPEKINIKEHIIQDEK